MSLRCRLLLICSVLLLSLLPFFLSPTSAEAAVRGGKRAEAVKKKKLVAKKKKVRNQRQEVASRKKPQERRSVSPALMSPPPAIEEEYLLAEMETGGPSAELVREAFSFVGLKYRFGGEGERGIDCSAYVKKVFSLLNLSLPRTAREQFSTGRVVDPDELKTGDLVFFQTYAKYASHVGIYLGNDRMIHASSHGRRVMVSSMNTPYFKSRYLGARRIDGMADSGIEAMTKELVEDLPKAVHSLEAEGVLVSYY